MTEDKELTDYEMSVANLQDFVDHFHQGKFENGVAMEAEDAESFAASIDTVLRCHAEELADLSRTIRNLSADNQELAEQETAR